MKAEIVFRKNKNEFEINKVFLLNVVLKSGFVYSFRNMNLSIIKKDIINEQLVMKNNLQNITSSTFCLPLKEKSYQLYYNEKGIFSLTCKSWKNDRMDLIDVYCIGDQNLDEQIWQRIS